MKRIIGAALAVAISLGGGVSLVQAKEVVQWFEDETIAFPGYVPHYYDGPVVYGDSYISNSKYLEGVTWKNLKKEIDIKGMYVTWDDATKQLMKVIVVFNKYTVEPFESLFINTNYNPADSSDWQSWDYFVNTDDWMGVAVTDKFRSAWANDFNVEGKCQYWGLEWFKWTWVKRNLLPDEYIYGGTVPGEGIYQVKSDSVFEVSPFIGSGEMKCEDITPSGKRGYSYSDTEWGVTGRGYHPNGLRIMAVNINLIEAPVSYSFYANRYEIPADTDDVIGYIQTHSPMGREGGGYREKKYQNYAIVYDLKKSYGKPMYLGDHFVIGFTTWGANDVMLASGMTEPEPR